jgi:hypothetical protein
MAAQYLTKAHFTGMLKIDFGNYDNFDDIATFVENKYMTKLFGVHLRETVSLESGQSYQDGDTWKEHHGTTEMLKYFFFYEFMTKVQNDIARTDKIEEVYSYSVSGQRDRMNFMITGNWNIAVTYYNELVDYVNYLIDEGSTDYEGFDPESLEKVNVLGV